MLGRHGKRLTGKPFGVLSLACICPSERAAVVAVDASCWKRCGDSVMHAICGPRRGRLDSMSYRNSWPASVEVNVECWLVNCVSEHGQIARRSCLKVGGDLSYYALCHAAPGSSMSPIKTLCCVYYYFHVFRDSSTKPGINGSHIP